MRLSYETGIATLVQFIILSLLNIADAVDSIIVTCAHNSGDCVGNMLASIAFYILIVAWFGVIVSIGYVAQAKRSKKLCQALMAAEFLVVIVAGYNIKSGITNHSGALPLFTSFIDLILSVWVITLAFRLMKARGGRVVARRRVRHHAIDEDE